MKFKPMHHRRRGTTVADLLVAATLLAIMMTTMMTLTVRTGQLRQQTRQQQLALDELANQLERLLNLNTEDLKLELATLPLSEHLVSLLPGATLTGQSFEDERGTRIELRLRWDQAIQSKPLSLVGWVDAGSSVENQP